MIDLFFQWYFHEVPAKIKKIWGNYLWYYARYFAIGDLGREFLAPWKGLVFHREKRAFEFGDALSAWFGNIISRVIGAIMRSFFLAAGLAMELLTLIAGALAFVVWALMFILIPLSFFFGFWLLFA
jgi:hypothetical protein